MDLVKSIFGWLTLAVWIALFAVAEILHRNPGSRPLLIAVCVLLAFAIPTVPISAWLHRSANDSGGGLVSDQGTRSESVASLDRAETPYSELPEQGD
ncbi:hypothetical protein [Lacipirellula parvula]|uniref:hypothetical protein n=1 Tax=Lacipirellula parvula TaxID=2650471 RepID=UPI001260A2DB|nr:hypothetical protein [Lacipirellula parvula]